MPMLIDGVHAIISSTDADADRAFLRDVVGLPSVDVGGGWLIFGLPPAELAVHPAGGVPTQELYLMCPDLDAFLAAMRTHKVRTGAIQRQSWGRLSWIKLPSGSRLSVYQPTHARPKAARRRR